MRLNFRNAVELSLLIALTLASPVGRAQEKQPGKKASAIQVKMIGANEVPIPAEFKVSLYEQLIDQLQKKGIFQHVYRDGDRTASSASDLIALQCTVAGFKKGSETMRQVTTVAGATSITLLCQFRDQTGASLLDRKIEGKVKFFGGNLKATYDFAKKTARVAEENFSAAGKGVQ